MPMSEYKRRLRQHVGHDLLLSVGAMALIFDDQGRVLMQKRSDFQRWGMVGGAEYRVTYPNGDQMAFA